MKSAYARQFDWLVAGPAENGPNLRQIQVATTLNRLYGFCYEVITTLSRLISETLVMTKDDLKLSLALPGEWALKSLLGPTFAELGDDLKRLYAGGRDRIIAAACKKLRDPEDGKKANLRVARDVFWNGAFSDDEICAEYFGGVLAASRSNDGKDDRNIQFVATIKSLSSSQLRLHCFIYTRLNQLLCRSGKHVNVGMGEEIQAQKIYFLSLELESLGVRHDTDFPVLHQHGLLFDYKYTRHVVRGKSGPRRHDGADHTSVKQSEIDNSFVTLVSRRG